MFSLWREYIRPEADLCCYWFEKARHQIELGKCQSSRVTRDSGDYEAERTAHTLNRIKRHGRHLLCGERPRLDHRRSECSYFNHRVRRWREKSKILDGINCRAINSNLTSSSDITRAQRLPRMLGIAFMGIRKGGPFDSPERRAIALLDARPIPTDGPTAMWSVPGSTDLDVTRRAIGTLDH